MTEREYGNEGEVQPTITPGEVYQRLEQHDAANTMNEPEQDEIAAEEQAASARGRRARANGVPLRERVKIRRALRQEMIELRAENPDLGDEEFKAFAKQYFKDAYDGYGIDPATLALILQIVVELLPLIIEIFKKRG